MVWNRQGIFMQDDQEWLWQERKVRAFTGTAFPRAIHLRRQHWTSARGSHLFSVALGHSLLQFLITTFGRPGQLSPHQPLPTPVSPITLMHVQACIHVCTTPHKTHVHTEKVYQLQPFLPTLVNDPVHSCSLPTYLSCFIRAALLKCYFGTCSVHIFLLYYTHNTSLGPWCYKYNTPLPPELIKFLFSPLLFLSFYQSQHTQQKKRTSMKCPTHNSAREQQNKAQDNEVLKIYHCLQFGENPFLSSFHLRVVGLYVSPGLPHLERAPESFWHRFYICFILIRRSMPDTCRALSVRWVGVYQDK